MSEPVPILPPNHSPLEAALEGAVARTRPDLGPVARLMHPDACPAPLLPWLAWALSVDIWDRDWPEATQRAAVAASLAIHRRKGTVASVRAAIAAFGYGTAVIVEGFGGYRYDGDLVHDGAETYGTPDHWAEYRVYLDRPITLDQAEQLTAILRETAPARCHLKGLSFTRAAHRYNGAISYDGIYSYGVAA
ncbi:phage tail protein I [Palleronia caenipelagi]|uniref:Phage tail protein I n=1 Tax=Palleronia caenipelagi TaxID=2489174 RepID=A0A547PWA3_9RHOB|nr:phage tail protein I [Palleronia caenipelagi]TRD18396.1 phage tail protein I [Palleronia caenipelagi]